MSIADIEHDNPAVGFALRDMLQTFGTYQLTNGEIFDLLLHGVQAQALESTNHDRAAAGQMLTTVFAEAVADVLDPNRERVVQ